MAKSSFLSGMIGVAVGALLVTIAGVGETPTPVSRSESARVERALARGVIEEHLES